MRKNLENRECNSRFPRFFVHEAFSIAILADRLPARNVTLFRRGEITFAELDAGVQGWINHVRYGSMWGLRRQLFNEHPVSL